MSATNLDAVTVVLCVDRNVLPGLHVTLYTALLHLDAGRLLDINLFAENLSETDYEHLTETLKRTHKPFKLHLHPADVSTFRNLPWQGGWMTYFRLVVPELLSEPKILYLDADLIVLRDLSELYDLDMQRYEIGAASWASIKSSNDRQFFQSLQYDVDVPYFNAGVLLVDREKWLANDLATKCLQTAAKFGRALPTMDQTVLNLVFYDNFLPVPRHFNTPVSASRKPLGAQHCQNRVIHLVAYPKPWDGLGILNGQYHLFRHYLQCTAFNGGTVSGWKWRYVRKIRALIKCFPNLLINLRQFQTRARLFSA